MGIVLPFMRRDDHEEPHTEPATEVIHHDHDGRGPAIVYDTPRSIHPVRIVLWLLGPVVALFGLAAPHLFSVGILLLVVQATNRWGLRAVRPSVKFVFVTALATAALITTQPVIGERLAATIIGAWNGITGNA